MQQVRIEAEYNLKAAIKRGSEIEAGFTAVHDRKANIETLAEDTPNGPQYGFTAHVVLDQQTLLVENQTVALQPGMTAQADIKTGQRRLNRICPRTSASRKC